MRLVDLLRIDRLGLTLLSGKNNLDREIAWVYTAAHVDTERYLDGGELVLTSTTWWTSPEDSERFVAGLVEAGAVGLVAGAAALPRFPVDLVLACDRHGLPLMAIADDVSFSDVSRTVIDAITQRRATAAQRVLEHRRSILREISRASSADTVLSATSLDGGFDVWLMSAAGRRLAGRTPLAELELYELARGAREAVGATTVLETSAGAVTVIDDPRRGLTAQLMACLSDHRGWSVDTHEIVDYATEVARARLDQAAAENADVARATASVIDSVAHGRPVDTRSALTSLVGAHGRYRCVEIRCRPTSVDHAEFVAAELAGFAVTDVEGTRHATIPVDGGIALVLALPDAPADDSNGGGPELDLEQWQQRSERIAELLPALTRVAVGVGRLGEGVAAVRRSMVEAQTAAVTALNRDDRVLVCAISDLSTAAALLTALPEEVRADYRDRVLGPLIDYDRVHRTELVDTLTALLASDGSMQSIADARHMHVNTLRYRIRKISELLGRDISRGQDRLDVEIALLIHRMHR